MYFRAIVVGALALLLTLAGRGIYAALRLPPAAPATQDGCPVASDGSSGRGLFDVARNRLLAAVTPDDANDQSSVYLQLTKVLEYEPAAWPEDVPEAFRESAVTAALDRAARASGRDLELVEMHCEEFPCIAVVDDHAEAPSNGTSSVSAVALGQALVSDDAYSDANLPSSTWKTQDGAHQRVGIAVVPYPHVGAVDDLSVRVSQRLMFLRNEERR